MEFLYLLEKIRTPFWDSFFLLITQFGEETAFLILALTLFWCVDKYKGYYILSVGFIGITVNQFMKLWFRVPRPWNMTENFTCVIQAKEGAGGYSFPSGHTQTVVGAFGGLAYSFRNRAIRIISIALIVLVGFSRMYLGVHTPMDVFMSIALGIFLIVVLKPIVLNDPRKYMPWVLGSMFILGIAFMSFVLFYKFPVDIDLENKNSALENACTLIGALIGLIVVYFVDEKWLHFPTNALWWSQILKVAFGAVLVLLVQRLLKEPLNMALGNELGRVVRYFVVVIVAGAVWPLTFRWFKKLGQRTIL